MKRRVLYMCHPVGGDVENNIKRALRWLAWLRRSYPGTTFVAPWIAGIMSGEDDADPAQREAGLVDCEATVQLLDGAVLVGGRVSTGMQRERASAVTVFDLTALGDEPPGDTHWFTPDAHRLSILSSIPVLPAGEAVESGPADTRDL